MAAKDSDKLRHVSKPKNYADLMRKTRGYHGYSFNLPRSQASKADLNHIRKSKVIKSMFESGQYTVPQIQAAIKRKAIDRAIDRKLSPQQKTAITKQWYGTRHKHGLKNAIQAVEENEAQFVKLPRANKREILNRMQRTNAGFFVREANVKVKLKGKGKSLHVEIIRAPEVEIEPGVQIFRRREMFFPFPKGVIIPDYVAYLYDIYKPNSVAIGVMSAPGNASYSNISGLEYVYDAIQSLKMRNKSHPFSGVYFYWF